LDPPEGPESALVPHARDLESSACERLRRIFCGASVLTPGRPCQFTTWTLPQRALSVGDNANKGK
jgi:hypothetical protein